MLLRFWGTRGSIPTPGRRTTVFGGNTSCVEIRTDDGEIVLLDCGTGARPLGLDIVSRGGPLPPIHILVTHTHWDHIQGFPFFLPAYVPGGKLTVYGARGLDTTLEASLSGQMQHTYFPVQLGELRADIRFVELSEEEFPLGRFKITTQYLNHTAMTIGYRLEVGDLTIVYATDHEPFWWTPSTPKEPNRFDHPGDQRHLEFVSGADLLIHDAQYIDGEYPAKRGWGHSTIEYVTDLAIRGKVKQLSLFHHEPLHTDTWIRKQTERSRRRARAQGSEIKVFAAAEGFEVALPHRPAARVKRRVVRSSARPGPKPTGRIIVAGSDPEGMKEVHDALAPDGYKLTSTYFADLTPAVKKVRPDLLVFVGTGSEAMLLDIAEHVRSEPWGKQVPILVLSAAEGPGATGRLIGNVTDVLSRPFSAPMLRARLRAWLGRTGMFEQQRTTPRPQPLVTSPSTEGKGLLKGLPASERAALLAGALTCHFRPGEMIFREGDPPGGVYFLRNGRVQISVKLGDGKEQILAVAKVGDTVGELAALDRGPRTATALALEATTTDYVPQDVFEAGLSAAPGAAVRLLRLMARRLRQTDHLIGELAPLSDKHRRTARRPSQKPAARS